MQSRCQKICPQAGRVVFGTFHSVFYQFLRKSEKYQNFFLINEKEKYEIMKKIIPCGTMTVLQHEYICQCMLKKISFCKNTGNDGQTHRRSLPAYCRTDSICYRLQTKKDHLAVILIMHTVNKDNSASTVVCCDSDFCRRHPMFGCRHCRMMRADPSSPLFS